jgi:deazaflavin-dependent oxidoreductase (nitroreductase family)
VSSESHYQAPAKGSNFFNNSVARLASMGISVYGSRLLCVKGRKTGQMRSTAVNPLTVSGERYLIAPRGNTQWVRNLRAANGEGELRLGRKTEPFTAIEIEDADKPAILRPYLKRYAFEVGVFFEGVNAKSPEAELQRIAPLHPVFRITPR